MIVYGSQNSQYLSLSPRFSKKKRGLCVTVRRPSVRPSVRPSGNSLPASPPTLLMLESPNLYAWYPYAYRWWQRIWNFSTSSSFEIIQILVILPKNAISLVIFHEIGSNFLSVWGKVIYIIYQTGFIMWLPDPLRKWKYRWRGADFEKKLFVTSVYQHLLLHYWC